jgi:hypothetical protein
MEDMRRLVIDAADVLTVLSRGGSRGKSKRQGDMRPDAAEVAQAELPAGDESAIENWADESPLAPDEE